MRRDPRGIYPGDCDWFEAEQLIDTGLHFDVPTTAQEDAWVKAEGRNRVIESFDRGFSIRDRDPVDRTPALKAYPEERAMIKAIAKLPDGFPPCDRLITRGEFDYVINGPLRSRVNGKRIHNPEATDIYGSVVLATKTFPKPLRRTS